MKILLITISFNEEIMLPHFINYYSQFCDKMIFCDGGSTDKSHEIIKANDKCELNLDYVSDKADDFTFLDIKNDLWKKYRKDYDWCIVVDIDEFVYYPDGLINLINSCENRTITVIRPTGYDMYSETPVTKSSNLFNDFRMGVPFENSSKMCIFSLKRLEDMNYLAGCHKATPIEYGGAPALCLSNSDIKLLHYRYLGLKEVLEKKRIAYSRLSERNKANGYGIHNTFTDEHWINSFNTNLRNSKQII